MQTHLLHTCGYCTASVTLNTLWVAVRKLGDFLSPQQRLAKLVFMQM